LPLIIMKYAAVSSSTRGFDSPAQILPECRCDTFCLLFANSAFNQLRSSSGSHLASAGLSVK
jgi:hypothetical protein